MALIPIFHVVAAERAVASGQSIKMGQVVSLNSDGEVVVQGSANPVAYGLAGDTKSTSASYMPGISSGWQNRVSDYYDETKASAKMTVYHSGGEFALDQFNANVASLAINAPLYAYNGILDSQNAQDATVVARLIKLAGTYPSGVPGIDINGDQALTGDTDLSNDTYIEIKLMI
jgi:hypothetical protein